jgi:hypothetical protein
MKKKASKKESKFNKNNQGLTSGAPTASVSKNIFGAGRIIQELRNRLVKLSRNTSHEKTILGLGNINLIVITNKRTPPPTPPRRRGGETKHSFGGVGFFRFDQLKPKCFCNA